MKSTPPANLPYKEEDASFQSGGVTLAGTLRFPLQQGKHPAVLLLQGSGDADRQAESFYADHFARHGIATLVYDKRGTRSSGGEYRKERFNDFAADALAGVHYLQSRPEINSKEVGLYGRSHGGIVAPLAASLSKDVAFVINVSGAGVPPYEQVTCQAEAQMRRDGFSETEILEAIAYMSQKWEVARKELETSDGYDPMPAFEKVKCPVLAVFGDLDTLTPVPQTIANFQKGLRKAGNKDYAFKVFPNADHALLVWPRPNDPSHWPVLASGYLDTLTNWINAHIGRRK